MGGKMPTDSIVQPGGSQPVERREYIRGPGQVTYYPSTSNPVRVRIGVDKRMYRVRFEGETEDYVDFVIEPKRDQDFEEDTWVSSAECRMARP